MGTILNNKSYTKKSKKKQILTSKKQLKYKTKHHTKRKYIKPKNYNKEKINHISEGISQSSNNKITQQQGGAGLMLWLSLEH